MSLGSLPQDNGGTLPTPEVPAGTYACDIEVPDFGGQHVEATAVVTHDGCELLAGAKVAVPELETTFLRLDGVGSRSEHASFSVSAETRHDVRLRDLLEATRFVLGRNTGWDRAASLWHDRDGRPLGEVLAMPFVSGVSGTGVYEEGAGVSFEVVDGLKAKPGMVGQARSLLIDADMDFVPSISSRDEAMQPSFGHGYRPSMSVEPYLGSIIGQPAVVATESGELVGLLSWKPQEDGNCRVSTVVTRRRRRGTGIGRRLYETFEGACGAGTATVRTWSTNWPHLALLRDMGWVETGRMEDHRAEGIGTVFLSKDLGNPDPPEDGTER